MATTASTNIYVEPLMPIEKREIYENFMADGTVFVPSYIYEGGYTSPRLYLEYGIEQLNSAGSYEVAVLANYDKTLYFGNVKSLAIYDTLDEYLYDLVYVELVDPIDGVAPFVLFDDGTRYVYPNSLENMRNRLENISLSGTPIQINLDVPLYILSAKKAGIDPFNGVILCKAIAGKGKSIIARIKKRIKKKLFNFMQFDFTFDRFIVETTAVSTASTYLIFPKRTI
jgi:hypothetical protein